MEGIHTEVDLSFIVFTLEGQNEAESLASYLQRHGIEAESAGSNEVTCPIASPSETKLVYQLRKLWPLWWKSCDQELYGFSFYARVDPN